MNYQEFIKNIYTSLKSINLKQQKLEEHFQTTFLKIEDLDNKVNIISNKLDDFIDTNHRLKEEKQITLSNSLNSISENLTSIQTEQDDIITTMTDVENIEENMTVLLDDYLSNEQIITDEIILDTNFDNELPIQINNTVVEESNNTVVEESNNTDSTQSLQLLDLNHESEDELLILE